MPGGLLTGQAPDVSVIIPVFEHAAYLPRALGGLLAQDGCSWEVVLVDDGSTDAPDVLAKDLLAGRPLQVHRHDRNRGLGAACNTGLAAAGGRYVAYLSADDLWYAGHLRSLVAALDDDPDAVAAHSGVRVGEHDDASTDTGLQAVQMLHRRDAVRWRERDELESDDLERTVWQRLRAAGRIVDTGLVTCEWSTYPGQRSRLLRAGDDGGLNPFRSRYRTAEPLRIEPSDGDPQDEHDLYGLDGPPAPAGDAGSPHVLLVGELAYNADRVLDLLPHGLRLSGLWIDNPLGFMTVGPLPFGGVTDVPREAWRERLRADPPDVVYALLNWRTVPLALAVADALPDVPLLWHFKEAPQRCLARGQWPQLAALWQRADQVLVCSDEERDWLLEALPGRRDAASVGVLDGDLPRGRWFGPSDSIDPHKPSPGAVHTVCLGRPIGLTPELAGVLAAADIHVHLHGLPAAARADWLAGMLAAAPGHVHVHPTVAPPRWRTELGRYDAGWLHAVPHDNGGELRRATWDDLNVPSRLPTLAAAGLPVLLPDCGTSISTVNRIVGAAGIVFDGPDALVDRIRDTACVASARAAMQVRRREFSFAAVADRLAGTLRTLAEEGRPR